MDTVLITRARKLLATSFKKIGNQATALRLGKHDSQVTRWRAGGAMTRTTADLVVDKLGHRRVK